MRSLTLLAYPFLGCWPHWILLISSVKASILEMIWFRFFIYKQGTACRGPSLMIRKITDKIKFYFTIGNNSAIADLISSSGHPLFLSSALNFLFNGSDFLRGVFLGIFLLLVNCGRRGWIRTADPVLPGHVLYPD